MRIDYDKLYQNLTNKTFKYEDVKDQLVKVAFDIYRFKNDTKDELWEIDSCQDGSFIVAKYTEDDNQEQVKTASKHSFWSVSSSFNNVSVSYKGVHINKFAAETLGGDVETLEKMLPARLASDKELVKALMKTVSKEDRETILNTYPELA